MKRAVFAAVLMAGVALSGCSTVYEPHTPVSAPEPVFTRAFISFDGIQKGQTRADVKAVLGHDVVIGYEMPDVSEKSYVPVTLKNPHRVEEYTKGSRRYVIDYYVTGIHQSDGVITDDELTPLVFEDDRLAGWGWGFLNTLKGR